MPRPRHPAYAADQSVVSSRLTVKVFSIKQTTFTFIRKHMKSIIIKASAVTAILLASAGAYASTMDCCGGLECCVKMLACCF